MRLQIVAAWNTELAAARSRRANRALSCGDSACWTACTNSWPSTTKRVAAVYSAASAGEDERRHQHDVGALEGRLDDPGDGPGRGVGPELAGEDQPRRRRCGGRRTRHLESQPAGGDDQAEHVRQGPGQGERQGLAAGQVGHEHGHGLQPEAADVVDDHRGPHRAGAARGGEHQLVRRGHRQHHREHPQHLDHRRQPPRSRPGRAPATGRRTRSRRRPRRTTRRRGRRPPPGCGAGRPPARTPGGRAASGRARCRCPAARPTGGSGRPRWR